jgi:hypothetical protein
MNPLERYRCGHCDEPITVVNFWRSDLVSSETNTVGFCARHAEHDRNCQYTLDVNYYLPIIRFPVGSEGWICLEHAMWSFAGWDGRVGR